MDHKIEINTALLTRYLAGEATPDEAMAIDDWLLVGENEQEFERLLKIWQLTPGSAVHVAPQWERAWDRLEAALPAENTVSRWKWLSNRYAMAAMLTGVLLTAGIYWFLQVHRSQQWQYAGNNTEKDIRKTALPDGSAIVINRNSTLQYAADYNQHDRKVLLEGECYFDVEASREKPFIIHAGELKILVLGTSFNVKKDKEGGTVEVAVSTGKVKMYTDKRELIVAAGHTGVYNAANGTLITRDVIDANRLGYVTGDLFFNDTPLPEICRYLENTFDVKIILDNPRLSTCRMSAHFKNRSVAYIMDIIAATLNVHYTFDDKVIHINGNGCN